MIKVLSEIDEKNYYKKDIEILFSEVYKKDLSTNDWNFIIGSSSLSVMIVFLHNGRVEGLSNLLYHTQNYDAQKLEFYVYTTSVLSEKFRKKGAYLSIFMEIKSILIESSCKFVIAYPNKVAYPILTSSFFGFKNFRSFKMIEVEDPQSIIVPCDMANLLDIDENYSFWRFKKNDYYYTEVNNLVFICKDYNNTIDVLEIFKTSDYNSLNIDIPFRAYKLGLKNYNIPSFRLKNSDQVDHDDNQMICYLSKEKNSFDPINLDFSCLCWDIL